MVYACVCVGKRSSHFMSFVEANLFLFLQIFVEGFHRT